MRARAGFTLVELLVGLTVASLALLAGMSTIGFVSDRSTHAEEVARVAIGGATQRAMLFDWLNNAQLTAPTGERFEGMEEDLGGLPTDLLMVPTTARTPLAGSVTAVGLYIDIDPETPEQGLVAEMTGMVAGVEVYRMELVPQAGRLHLRYLGTAGDEEWLETWQSNRLPRGLELTLDPWEGDTLPTLLRYPIRVALRSGR
jgi:prepilin-type N-terminal cleavage/methylation domain-containing protein